MSGTSVDAVDGALVAFPVARRTPGMQDASGARPAPGLPTTLAFRSRPMPPALRAALQALQQPGHDELARAALAANSLSDLYADVVADLLEAAGCRAADLAAIGAHGQTVRHRPELGYTIQLLNPARLAERSGIAVIADFRTADLAAGGQGAPLAPGFHATVFAHPLKRRAIVNLGGIANVSLIAPADSQRAQPVIGFDTGPANTLLDDWCRRHTGQDFDRDGAWAAQGKVIGPLLARMLDEPYFKAPAPKSTGRDLFERAWLDAQLKAVPPLDPRDVQATLAELTAVTVAEPCRAFGAEEIWICGGGVNNADLMRRLADRLAPAVVSGTDKMGIDPQAVEATAFAWLAHQRLSGKPGNLPAVTGAEGPRVLGAVWPAPLRPRTRSRSRSSSKRSDS
jgi:anhydro-N-acetylmuramic acid kinase